MEGQPLRGECGVAFAKEELSLSPTTHLCSLAMDSKLSYDKLAALYRQQVVDKLPPAALLSPALLAAYPPGSNVSKVPETCGVLSAEQITITSKDATELVRAIAAGELSAEEVTLAFGLRAALAHQLVRRLILWEMTALIFSTDLLPDRLFPGRGAGASSKARPALQSDGSSQGTSPRASHLA